MGAYGIGITARPSGKAGTVVFNPDIPLERANENKVNKNEVLTLHTEPPKIDNDE